MNKIQTGNELGTRLIEALGLPKDCRSIELSMVAGQEATVKCVCFVGIEGDAFGEMMAEYQLVKKGEPKVSDDQIKHMVDRFLAWRLPENFHPDAGISFKAEYNEHTPHPNKHEPTGTNLFDAQQAEAMIRHLVAGMPCN